MAMTLEQQIQEMEILDPTPQTVVFGIGENARTYTLRPLVIKHYKTLFLNVADAMAFLMTQIRNIGGQAIIDEIEKIKQDPTLIANYAEFIMTFGSDFVIKILAAALDPDDKDLPKWLEENMDAVQMSNALIIIFKQNEVAKIVENFTLLGKILVAKLNRFPGVESTPNSGTSTQDAPKNT